MIRFVQRETAEPGAELEALGLPEALLRLLCARGLTDKDSIEKFLQPSLSYLHDPMQLSDMPKAVALVEKTLASGGEIVVYGDYDVDGICATSILLTYLKKRGGKVRAYIPSRHEEGYGLNEAAVRSLAGTALLITVDCGITSPEEVRLAQSLGMAVIITDHHQLGPELPLAEAVVNPILAGYPFPKLCGAGVAWKLVWALGGQEAAMPLVDLAALATVADLVPLLGENRVIVKEGLAKMQQCERPGLTALIEVAGLSGKELTAGHLGFQLAPRLNAAGRLQDAMQGVHLMTRRDQAQALTIARELDARNSERRALEQRMLEEALAKVEQEMDFQRQRCIVLCGEGWNEGVIGLVASRLVDRYRWPVLLLARQGDTCTGSARSIPGINIHTALNECRDLFTRFGGHSAAAGLSMPFANVETLKQRLSDAVAEQETDETFLPSEGYDLELPLSEVTEDLVKQLERLAPTGIGNPAPVLLSQGLTVSAPRTVGKEGDHLKLSLSQGAQTLDAIAFRMGLCIHTLPEKVDVLYAASLNTWQEETKVQMEVRCLEPSAPAKAFRACCMAQEQTFLRAIYAQFVYNSNIIEEDVEKVERLSTQEMDDALRAAMAEGRQGVLLIVQTLPALRKWVVRLNVTGAELEYAVGSLSDARMYHTLLAAPQMPPVLPARPRIIALLDGAFSPALVDELRKAAPDARILLAEDAGDIRRQALADLMPGTDEDLRALYRVMRTMEQGTPIALAAQADWLPARTMAALDVFTELRLAAQNEEKTTWKLLPPQKCELSESSLLRTLRAAGDMT